MKTTARYTKGRGDASVHARTRVFARVAPQPVELDVVGRLDSEHRFRILGSADEAAALAHERLDAAMKIRAIEGDRGDTPASGAGEQLVSDVDVLLPNRS
ncbi:MULTISPECIES: hypothetical protein [unclassified Burkholderia]|uniref:hypothetical protein n=1 Tax=unclassified Burkholderia TaxID=2613784 RepID=UPI000AB9711A|nr:MULTISPECIES: hypothetical protein [unclassified Burkholderia]